MPSKRAYCEMYGYDLIQTTFSSIEHLGFKRFEITLIGLECYDLCAWIDGDAIITNPAIRLENIGSSPLTASIDWWCADGYFSMGNFILRRHPLLQDLKHAYFAEKWHRLTDPNQEQNTLNEVWKRRPELVSVLPHGLLNGVPSAVREDPVWADRGPIVAPWTEGNFVAHYTGTGDETRLKLMLAWNASL